MRLFALGLGHTRLSFPPQTDIATLSRDAKRGLPPLSRACNVAELCFGSLRKLGVEQMDSTRNEQAAPKDMLRQPYIAPKLVPLEIDEDTKNQFGSGADGGGPLINMS